MPPVASSTALLTPGTAQSAATAAMPSTDIAGTAAVNKPLFPSATTPQASLLQYNYNVLYISSLVLRH